MNAINSKFLTICTLFRRWFTVIHYWPLLTYLLISALPCPRPLPRPPPFRQFLMYRNMSFILMTGRVLMNSPPLSSPINVYAHSFGMKHRPFIYISGLFDLKFKSAFLIVLAWLQLDRLTPPLPSTSLHYKKSLNSDYSNLHLQNTAGENNNGT